LGNDVVALGTVLENGDWREVERKEKEGRPRFFDIWELAGKFT
jgi:hypothetical protein